MSSTVSPPSRERNIAILGGGVLGLTTALELASSHPTAPSTPRLNIHILARDLASTPEGLLSQQWASPWAGFNWCSFATKDDMVTQSRDRLAYLEWKRIVETGELPGSTMARMPFVQYLPEGITQDDIWFKDFVDDFEYHPSSSDSDPRPCIKYTSFGVNTPLYLAYLIERLRSFDYVDGGRVSISFHQTETFESLAEAYAYCKKTFAAPTSGSSTSDIDSSWLLINATGLGSLTLTDVLDKEVYPIRGQTILLRVPPAFTNSPRCVMDVISPPAYLIPRGAGSGQVILGGTFGNDEWDTRVSEEDTERILRECWRLCPDILDGPAAGSGEEAVEMLRKQIISVNVGLRPARRGDVARVELDAVKVNGGDGDGAERVPVLHCYGAGKAGYQSSLGIAKEARELVEAHYRELEG